MRSYSISNYHHKRRISSLLFAAAIWSHDIPVVKTMHFHNSLFRSSLHTMSSFSVIDISHSQNSRYSQAIVLQIVNRLMKLNTHTGIIWLHYTHTHTSSFLSFEWYCWLCLCARACVSGIVISSYFIRNSNPGIWSFRSLRISIFIWIVYFYILYPCDK